jgi:Ser/Thr protein kinase RdoA (MazF antagonist)
LPFDQFPQSLIHGDLFLDNVIVSEMNDLWFIDFEGGCIDNSLFDLARAMIGCAIVEDRLDLELCNVLLMGYSMTRNLTDLENEYLYEYIIYAGVVSTLWRYTEFNLDRQGENKNHIYRELLIPVKKLILQGKKSALESLPKLNY